MIIPHTNKVTSVTLHVICISEMTKAVTGNACQTKASKKYIEPWQELTTYKAVHIEQLLLQSSTFIFFVLFLYFHIFQFGFPNIGMRSFLIGLPSVSFVQSSTLSKRFLFFLLFVFVFVFWELLEKKCSIRTGLACFHGNHFCTHHVLYMVEDGWKTQTGREGCSRYIIWPYEKSRRMPSEYEKYGVWRNGGKNLETG